MITLHAWARFGLARAAVYWQGKPHLYAEGYEYDPSLTLLGARSVARLTAKRGGMAFLSLAGGEEAVLEVPQEALHTLHEGAAVEIEIMAEARGDKLARGRFIAIAEGEPRRLSEVVSLKNRLLARARLFLGEQPVTESDDPGALDDARDEAVNPTGPLAGGGFLSVEPTRALIACDVDTSSGGEGRTFAKLCNEQAVSDLPRRLRLSCLAGLIVVDLIGKRHDAVRLTALLKAGFGQEAAQIITTPIGRFGTLEFVRPWGARPARDGLSPVRDSLYMLQQAIAAAGHNPGRAVVIRARQAVIDVLRPLLAGSLDPLTPMLRLEAAPVQEIVTL